MVSRDIVERVKSVRYPPPPVGHYYPKYSKIDKFKKF